MGGVIVRLWIARDKAIIPDDMEHYIERHPEKEIDYAKLHIFYDKPKWDNSKGVWYCAREMCDSFYENFKELIEECKELL